GAIHADADGVGAKMAASGEAVAATAADHVAFAADNFAGEEVVHVLAHFHDLADELVADDHRHGDRLLRPRIPLVDMQVRAADAGAVDADEHVVDAAGGLGDIFEPEARFGFGFDESFHGRRWPLGISEKDKKASGMGVYDAGGKFKV